MTLGPLPDVSENLDQGGSGIDLADGDGMEGLVLNEITPDRQGHRRNFPFGLGGQARIGPACVGVRFVVTDMTHGFGFRHGSHPGKGHHPPGAIPLFPIQRGLPPFALDRIPTHGQPQLRPFVPSIGHEGQILAVGDQPRRQLEPLDKAPMPRELIIEGETLTVVANPVDAFEKAHPSERAHRRHRCRDVGGYIRRSQGIAGEVIFHIGQE